MEYFTHGFTFTSFQQADYWAKREAKYDGGSNILHTVYEKEPDGSLQPVAIWSRHADH